MSSLVDDLDTSRILVLEPLYGGCHKKLFDTMLKYLKSKDYTLITMAPEKWNWRLRTSAMYMAQQIPREHTYEILFCSSVLPLSELLGLRPDLVPLFKVVYFHENHIAMTMNASKDLRYQVVYNEVLTCIAADQVLFNSKYNMKSFLRGVNKHMRKHIDNLRNPNTELEIKKKSCVVYFPLNLLMMDVYLRDISKLPTTELYIVWPHRWEFDKAPQMFYRVIKRLINHGYQFKVVMFPQSFTGKPTDPDVLIEQCHTSRLLHLEDAESNLTAYYTIMKRADVIVSTAKCEFFGSQILEGMYCDLIPVVPRLPIYEELFKNKLQETYETEDELYHILAELCRKKDEGVLNKTYKNLARNYESNKWFRHLLKVLGCRLLS